MLRPRDSDLLALFLVLVVLPVVTYIVLGKWSEASKKKQKLSLLAHLAAEESFRVETMATASVIPLASPPKAALHECARCHAVATTRCSRCKSVRYCSGKCQIIHWRLIHKDECQPSENIFSSSPDRSLFDENISRQFSDASLKQPLRESTHLYGNDSTDINASVVCSSSMMGASKVVKAGRRSVEKRASRKSSREVIGKEERSTSNSADDISGSKTRLKPSKEVAFRNKFRHNDTGESALRGQSCIGLEAGMVCDYGAHDALNSSECAMNAVENVTYDTSDNWKSHEEGANNAGKVAEGNSFNETIPNGRVRKPRIASHFNSGKICKSSKPVATSSMEQPSFGKENKGEVSDDPTARSGSCHAQGGNGNANVGFMKMMGMKRSTKVSKKDASEVHVNGLKKVKMLFPYEEFMKFFQYDIFDLTPRGLSNCGNSCYANAVFQCLTATKPLLAYLLKRTHSRACCVKRWCLMCELEQHVATMRDSAGPLSPSRILSQMRNMNCQMGDGSQEDAHEFLRLLVTSMQSICLEEVGGEKQIHPILQETTFIQHTFGGRLRSKVECLKCHHRSEQCENIMDLTLEIYGWVESLQDALTQFTAWEDLDGENMYKCGRCLSYVLARKQLSIDEAPNILTIALKRFQEGSYGKINKCITFPETLDMTPFMTGAYDIPPHYMLYAVIVHMDTLNASFSGHYISYVKDMQGNWLRIDDSEVQPVPMSQVMSEGAYILFYMRSSPRSSPAARFRALNRAKHGMPRSSRSESGPDPSDRIGPSVVYNSHTSNDMLRSVNPRFSDATSSSDWSLFTSSDDASFTTESTRDSFSTPTDYPDPHNLDPLASFFNSSCALEQSSQRTVSCRMFSGSQPVTGFICEEKGYVESYDPYLYPAYPYNWEPYNVPYGEEYDFAAYDGSSECRLRRTYGSHFSL